VLLLDRELKVVSASRPFLKAFRIEAKEAANRPYQELGDGRLNHPGLKRRLERVLATGASLEALEIVLEAAGGGKQKTVCTARRVEGTEVCPLIVLAFEGATGG
jgi:two-component system CheB/CheR fusion protein